MTTTEPAGLKCAWCNTWFTVRRSDQAYCSTACSKKADNLEGARGRRIYRAIYRWRLEHRTFGQNMAFVCREVAAWIREDREMQRPPPPPHNHDADRGHQRVRQAVRL